MSDVPFTGLGVGVAGFLIGAIIYFGIMALMLWIFYLIIRAAVTSGVLRASERGAFRAMAPPQYPPGPPTMGPGPGQPGGPPYRG